MNIDSFVNERQRGRSFWGCNDSLNATQLAAASRDETYRQCAMGNSAGLVTVADCEHDLYTDTGLPGHVNVAAYMWTHVFKP